MNLTRHDDGKYYSEDGQSFDAVTTVLGRYFDVGYAEQFHLDRGSAIHEYARYILMGLPYDKAGVHPEVQDYVRQLHRFVDETQFKAIACELQVYSKKYGVAGTLDSVGSFPGGVHAIIDFKTGTSTKPNVITRQQLAAYYQFYTEGGDRMKRKRFAVMINPDGYRLEPYDKNSYLMREDFHAFLANLNSYRWNKKYGVKK